MRSHDIRTTCQPNAKYGSEMNGWVHTTLLTLHTSLCQNVLRFVMSDSKDEIDFFPLCLIASYLMTIR